MATITYPTSQTFAKTTTSTRSIIERAYGALRIRPQQITGEMLGIALDLLLHIQQHLVNQSAPLWTLQKVLYPLVQGQGQYNLGPTTVDVAQNGAFFRLLQNITSSATLTYSSAAYDIAFTTPTQVSTVNVSWPSGSTGFGLTIQSSPDNATWTTVYTTSIYDASSGNVFLDLANSSAAQYFQVIPTPAAPANTLPVGFSVQVYNTPQEIQMARLNKDDYWNLPNKSFQGRPLQWWMDRQIQPVMNLWPVPDSTSAQNCMVVWRHRYLMDVGSMQQSIEFPPRWYFAIMYQLAAELAFTTPECDPAVIPAVQQKAAQMLRDAWTEERDASPIKFNVGIRQYTRG
jgi:hypothetical protein